MNDFVVFEIFACGFDLYRHTLHVSMIDRFFELDRRAYNRSKSAVVFVAII